MALKLIIGKEKDGVLGIKGKGKGQRSSKSPLKLAEKEGKSVNGKLETSEGDDDMEVNDKVSGALGPINMLLL